MQDSLPLLTRGTETAGITPVKTSYLSRFRSIRPKYLLSQTNALQGLVKLRLRMDPRPESWDPQIIENRIRRFGLANAQIESRGSEISDYQDSKLQPYAFFKDGKVPLLETRMEFFRTRTREVMNEFYESETRLPSDLVHVTCTGYTSPNAAQEISAKWAKDAKHLSTVTHAYHMGCYASLPAIRIARGLCFAKQTRTDGPIDIIHQEICSLHFDPLTLEPEQIVVQSLFADGHIRYSLTEALTEDGFEIKALREEIIPETETLMSWTPSSTHFSMRLSREVPVKLKHALRSFLDEILKDAALTGVAATQMSELIFAIHPGGPKIIEAVEVELGLTPNQTLESHEVLKHYGNMSSATLPHIWQKILQNPERTHGTYLVSLAFGPGLTLSGGVFQLCRQ